MKKLNKKGFTLIELLAVIVIMGILMVVAIPAISRTIENSRKDTFVDTAGSYETQVKNLWSADGLNCTQSDGTSVVSSAAEEGYYYVPFSTKEEADSWLLESGGKSPWGNRDVKGFVLVHATTRTVNGTKSTKVDYQTYMTDNVHSVEGNESVQYGRGDVKTNERLYEAFYDTDESTMGGLVDGFLPAGSSSALKCKER